MSDVEPGDHIVTPHPFMDDCFAVSRVVKIGKTMWELERMSSRGTYAEAARQKVTRHWKVLGDPITARKLLSDAFDEFREATRKARSDMLEKVLIACNGRGDA